MGKPEAVRTRGILSDLAHALNVIAFILIIVGVATPLWVEQTVDVGVGKDPIIGRGLFQVSDYDGYGVICLYPYYIEDAQGHDLDPFCGSSNATSVLAGITIPRNSSRNEWCEKRRASSGFAVLTLIFSILACISSVFIARQTCNQLTFIVLNILAVVCGFFASVIMGAFIREESNSVGDTPEGARLFPHPQSIKAGYSFIIFIIGYLLSLTCAIFSLMDWCCYKDNIAKTSVAPANLPEPGDSDI